MIEYFHELINNQMNAKKLKGICCLICRRHPNKSKCTYLKSGIFCRRRLSKSKWTKTCVSIIYLFAFLQRNTFKGWSILLQLLNIIFYTQTCVIFQQHKVVGLLSSARDRARPSLLDFPFAHPFELAVLIIVIIVGPLPLTTYICTYIYIYIYIYIWRCLVCFVYLNQRGAGGD